MEPTPRRGLAASSPPPASLDPVLTEPQAAELTGLSRRTLQRMRLEGGGPPFVRLSETRVGYRRSAIEGWLASRTFTSTSEESARHARRAGR